MPGLAPRTDQLMPMMIAIIEKPTGVEMGVAQEVAAPRKTPDHAGGHLLLADVQRRDRKGIGHRIPRENRVKFISHARAAQTPRRVAVAGVVGQLQRLAVDDLHQARHGLAVEPLDRRAPGTA